MARWKRAEEEVLTPNPFDPFPSRGGWAEGCLRSKYGGDELDGSKCVEGELGVVLLRIALGNVFLGQGGATHFH